MKLPGTKESAPAAVPLYKVLNTTSPRILVMLHHGVVKLIHSPTSTLPTLGFCIPMGEFGGVAHVFPEEGTVVMPCPYTGCIRLGRLLVPFLLSPLHPAHFSCLRTIMYDVPFLSLLSFLYIQYCLANQFLTKID